MNLAGYCGQLITSMRTYKWKHLTFTNSLYLIDSRKPVLHTYILTILPMEDWTKV